MPLVTRRTSSGRQVAAAASIRKKRLQSANTTAAAFNAKNDVDDKVGKRSESFQRLVKLVVAVMATLMVCAIVVASLPPSSSRTSVSSLSTALATVTAVVGGEGGLGFLDVAGDVVHSGAVGGGEAKNLRATITADPRPNAQSTSSSSTAANNVQLYPFYSTPSSSSSPLEPVPFPTIPHLEHCQVTFQAPPGRTSQSEWRTPLWAPSYPGSGGSGPNKKNGGGDLIKTLVERLTGHVDDQFHRPVKNYHMSIRNGRLKRCKGISETVLCTQGHPIVPVEPMKQTDNFQSTVIVPIRNPAVAFPVSVTDKAIAYHGLTGQVPEKEWLSTRDSYLEGSVEAWKNLIQYWQGGNNNDKDDNSYYHVGLFVPWEDLMDVPSSSSSSISRSSVEDIQNGRGPKVVQRLARTLQKAGFDVTTSVEDTTCIWYQVVQHEWQRQQDDVRMSYLPSYTTDQQKQMVDVLRQFQREEEARVVQVEGGGGGEGDESKQALLGLLNRYIDQIQNHLRLDVDAAATA